MPSRRIVRGQSVKRQKLERARELRRNMTDEERILWEALRAGRFPGLHFRRQQVIDGFIADFYCDRLGLVIEVDGGHHEARADYDAERDRVLKAHGLRVLRLSNAEVRAEIDLVLDRIRRTALTGQAAELLGPGSTLKRLRLR